MCDLARYRAVKWNHSLGTPYERAMRTATDSRIRIDPHWLIVAAMASGLGYTTQAVSQCSIPSSNGYTVVANVVPVDIVPSTMDCQWGYNYNVRLAYEIEFSGPNAPANLWTLQGNVVCGSQSLFFDLPNSSGSGVVTTTSNAWRGISDCATSDVSSLSCFSVRLQIDGPGISNQTVECAFSPLPMELISFDAEAIDSEVHLRWTTASETNSDRFVVERSTDGSNFDQVLLVPAAGNSSNTLHYSAIDVEPLTGTSYYRLRRLDRDGKQDLGPVVVIHKKELGPGVRIFPNPNADGMVSVTGTEPGSELLLYDPANSLVFASTIWSNTIGLPDLRPGVYMCVVKSPKGVRSMVRYVQQ